MKIRMAGTELVHEDRRTDGPTEGEKQTDMTKLILAFSQFCKRA
jgi:hypothetical protein